MAKKHYVICEDKCMIEAMSKDEMHETFADKKGLEALPKITYGTQLPPDSEGKEGDIFLLLEE